MKWSWSLEVKVEYCRCSQRLNEFWPLKMDRVQECKIWSRKVEQNCTRLNKLVPISNLIKLSSDSNLIQRFVAAPVRCILHIKIVRTDRQTNIPTYKNMLSQKKSQNCVDAVIAYSCTNWKRCTLAIDDFYIVCSHRC